MKFSSTRFKRQVTKIIVSCLLIFAVLFSSIPIYPGLDLGIKKVSASTNLRIEPSEINTNLGETTTISFSFNAADDGQTSHDIKINLCIPGANGQAPQLLELITSGTYQTKNAQGEYIVHEVEWDGKINGQALPEGRYYIAVSPASYNGIGVYYGQIGSFEIVNSKQPSPPTAIEVKANSTGQVAVTGASAVGSTVDLELRKPNGDIVQSFSNIAVSSVGQWSKAITLPANELIQVSARSKKDGLTSSYSEIKEVMSYSVPSYPVTWSALAAYYYKANANVQVENKVADIADWNSLNTLSPESTISGRSSLLLVHPQTTRILQQNDLSQFTNTAISNRLRITNPLWTDNVDPARGDFTYATDQLTLPAIMPLSFGLSYLSRHSGESSVGLGWLHSYDWKLTSVDGKKELLQPDGSRFEFIPLSDGTYLSPRGTDWTLANSGAGYVLKSLNNISYNFDTNGLLSSIVDLNGNRVELTYQSGLLSSVTTNGASLTLTYNGQGKLSSVADHSGRSLAYQYNAAGDMIAFVDVDGSEIKYTYDSEHHLIGVTDANQTAQMSVTYDENQRVVSFTDFYGQTESTQFTGKIAPVERGEDVEGDSTDPISIHENNARDIAESDVVILSGSMNNEHNAPAYKIVPGLQPVISDYLTRLQTTVTNSIETYKQTATTAADLAQIQQKIADSSGSGAVVLRTNYLSVEENITLGSPSKPVVLIAEGINSNQEVTITVYGDLILEQGLNGNTKLNLNTYKVNNNYGNLWAKGSVHLNNDSNVHVDQMLYAGALTYNSGKLAVSANRIVVRGDLSINTEVEMDIEKEMTLGGIVSNNLLANLTITNGDLFVRDNVSVNNQLSVVAGGVFAIGGNMTANKKPTIRVGVGNGVTLLKYPENSVVVPGTNSLTTQNTAVSGVSQTITPISETKSTSALNETTTYVWGDRFLLAEIKQADGSSVSYDYDDNERITAITDGNGYTSSFSYDANGNLLQSINGLGESTVTRYNNLNLPITTVDALGATTTYTYDSTGNLVGRTNAAGDEWITERDTKGVPTKITNELGASTQYVNNTSGFAEQIIDPTGYIVELTRDALNRVTEVRDNAGVIQSVTYDAKDRPVTVVNALQQSISGTYDANGNLVSYTDESGAVTNYEYDVYRQTAVIDALGQRSAVEYDANGNVKRTIDANGATRIYQYDSLGRVESLVDADGNTTNYMYDASGNLKNYTDGLGNSVNYTYNALGQTLTVTDELQAVTQYSYDAKGQLAKVTNAIGNSTWYNYDELGRLTSEINALGFQTSYTYDEVGNLVSTTDADGNVWETEYDERGYAVASTDPLGQVTRYTYDERGRLTQTTDHAGNSTVYEYNDLDQTTKLINALGHETFYTYNAQGQMATLTDANQQTTNYTYDALGQLIGVTDALGHQFSYSYDSVGNVISKTNANGATTTYTYTQEGLMTSEVNPLLEEVTVTYDANGNIATRTEADGTTTTYTYDEGNRIVNITYGDGQQVTYTYDRLGRRMTMEDSNGLTRYTYDALNRPTEIIDSRGQNIRYEWTATNQRSRVIYPDNRSVNYTYNEAGQLQTVIDGLGQPTNYTYDHAGRVTTKTLPTGATSSYTYDALGQVQTIEHKTAANELLEALSYTYDPVGNILSKQRQEQGSDEDRPTDTYKPATVETYNYNAINQLIQVQGQDGTMTTYTYDAAGNRVQKEKQELGNIILENYSYDSANKLLSLVSHTDTKVYSYDLRGNLTQVLGNATQETYSWDAANRLVSQMNEAGDITTYRYDGDNNRVYMGITVGSGTEQNLYPSGHPAGARKGWEAQYKKQQTSIYFTNDTTTSLPQPIYATDETRTAWEQSYVYGVNEERISMSYLPSADANTDWEPVAGASGPAPNATPETLYYLGDAQGSTLALLNSDNQVALRYHYDEFGSVADAEKFDLNYPGPDNLFGYTSLGYDASSGLSYARARYFDSDLGRFISEDTYEGELGNPLSLNLYTYVSNNPLKYTDPTGHWQQGDEKYSSDIQEELRYLTSMYNATDSKDSRAQIHAAANALRSIGDTGANYTAIRSKTYISSNTATDPFTGDVYNGNPNGAGLNSLDVKTLQYIVINHATSSVISAGFVGETVNYTTGETGRASVSGLTVTNVGKQLQRFNKGNNNLIVSTNVSVADPLIWYAAAINDNLVFTVNLNTGGVKLSGSIDGFPAHEVWIRSSGGSYANIYSYNDGNLYSLGPIYGNTTVSGSYSPK